MEQDKIIRTVCVFSDNPTQQDANKIHEVAKRLEENGFLIQTKRLASTLRNVDELLKVVENGVDYSSVGAISYKDAIGFMPKFLETDGVAFNIDLAKNDIDAKHVELLYDIIQSKPSKTFNFTYTFNNAASSPYFPSAVYERNGYAIGLQPTDLAHDCNTLEEWLEKMKQTWQEIVELFADDPEFLGIDSSIAPLFEGDSSFVNFIKRLGYTFDQTVTTNMYTTITKFIKEQNPKPVGLCGMMLPCTEDFELTDEYETGNFSIERNVYLSLHSGLGIDTYPIGIDEKPERVVEILKLVQSLSNKYNKPLSARFVSDGKAKIGEQSDFQDQYLKDCVIRAL